MEAETTESAFASVLNVCGVCKENLHGREPKLLSCLHVFCKQCVLNIIESKHSIVQNNSNKQTNLATCHVVFMLDILVNVIRNVWNVLQRYCLSGAMERLAS